MKAKNILIGLLALGTVLACKEDKKENTKEAPAAVEVEQNKTATGKVVVTLNAIVPVDDSFQVFYIEEDSLDFNGDFLIITPVKGKPEAQDIKFLLPDESYPIALRLDIGDNKKQGAINLNTVTVDYYGKSFVIKGGTEFLKYFYPNNVDVKNPTAASVTLVPVEVGDSHDPMFYPTPALLEALKTLVKAK